MFLKDILDFTAKCFRLESNFIELNGSIRFTLICLMSEVWFCQAFVLNTSFLNGEGCKFHIPIGIILQFEQFQWTSRFPSASWSELVMNPNPVRSTTSALGAWKVTTDIPPRLGGTYGMNTNIFRSVLTLR